MTQPFLAGLINSVVGPAHVSGNSAAAAAPTAERVTLGGAGTHQFDEGNGLLSTLSLPQGLNAGSTFAWQAHLREMSDGNMNRTGMHQTQQSPATLTQMTMAGAMSWLRDLAVNSPDDYNATVHQLVAAGYLTPGAARYGSYTTEVGNAFLRSAADVWNINNTSSNGQIMTWGDHIQALAQARIAAGQADANGMPLGSGGQGPQAPTRTDRYTSPIDTKAAINSAAENILGRKLTDKEAASFQSLYHGLEQKANDQVWQQQLSTFNNQSSTPNKAPDVIAPPTAANAAENYMDTAGGALGQERTSQLLGSYVGVLRNMTGLGAGGVSHAVS